MSCQKLGSFNCGEEEGRLKLVQVRGDESFAQVIGAVVFTVCSALQTGMGFYASHLNSSLSRKGWRYANVFLSGLLLF